MPISCPICERVIQNQTAFRTHYINKHPDAAPPVEAPKRTWVRPNPGYKLDMAEGDVHLNITLHVTAEEISYWQSENIKAFFDGLSQVLAASARIKK